jgi:TonB family protein
MKSEPDIWALVQKIGTREAYLMYVNRFRNGPHFEEARQAYLKLIGVPVQGVPSAPPPPPVRPAPAVSPLADPCIKLLVDEELKTSPSAEAKSVRAAQSSNRVVDYEAYLSNYPAGVCRDMATKKIRARATRRLLFQPIQGLGPLAAQRVSELTVSEDDYPAAALRAEEQGRVTAEWEVAEDGTVELCRTVQSSGSEALDSGTCRLIVSLLRYDPARDSNGVPIRSRDHATISWALPQESPTPPSDKQ